MISLKWCVEMPSKMIDLELGEEIRPRDIILGVINLYIVNEAIEKIKVLRLI